ncbi:MAG: hypothetical protein ACT4P6_11245, partial [Gemmatimonadaceae bacterium]
MRQLEDSLLKEGVAATAVRELAEKLYGFERYVQSAPPQPVDTTPLRIVGIRPDTALSGTEVELVLSRSLDFDKLPLDSVRQRLSVMFAELSAEVRSVRSTLVKVKVPDGTRRGRRYGIRAIVDDSLTPWYEGFVAGPSWSQTLRDPKYWFGTLIVIAL